MQIGTGVKPVATERLHSQGNLSQTSNALDIAIQGNGFFQVQMPDGTTSYTRDGSFQVNAQGQMVTASGFPVQPAITIPANATSVTVSQDGVVSVTTPSAVAAATVGTIQLANFINPAGLSSQGQNLYQETSASGTPTVNAPGSNGIGTLNQGYVETSNVDVAEQLVNMIQTQRSYELNSKVITTSDGMLQSLTQV
jgi:flagellar basal-body rod protein FlgG